MIKKMLTLGLVTVLSVACVSCGNNIENKESVSVKESELYSNFQLSETELVEPKAITQEDVTVTLSGITYEDVITKFDFHIKNDSEQKVKIVTTDFSINGLMCPDSMMVDVEAKTEKDSYIQVSNEWFSEMNIETVQNFEYVVRVLDENDNEISKSDVLKGHADAPEDYEQQYDEEGFVIYNKDGITFSARELKKSKLSNDMELAFYVENNTDKSFNIMALDVSVNGTPVDPTFVITVGAHKKAVDSMLFHEQDLTQGKISEFKTVKASFRAIDENLETIFETEMVEIPIS